MFSLASGRVVRCASYLPTLISPTATLAARGVPFAFSTGHNGHDMREGYRDRPVLKRPFRYGDLTEILTRVLAT